MSIPEERFTQAKWIWPRNDRTVNGHVLFRTHLDLEGEQLRATMHLAVESFARVFIDGNEVHRTSSISYPGQHYYETVDLNGAVHAGCNEISILAWYIGIPSGASGPKDPGLLVEVVDLQGVILSSNAADWKVLTLDAWRGQIRRSHWLNLDLVEILDFGMLPIDFPRTPVDERFSTPEATNHPGARFIKVEPRTFAKPGGTTLREFRILAEGTVDDHSEEFEVPALAVLTEPIESRGLGIENWNEFTLDAPPAGKAWSLILDLGNYEKGFPRLTVAGDSGTVVDLSWFEDLSVPGARALLSKVHATDRFILSGGADEIVPEEWKCGRHLQLTFRKIQTRLIVRRLRWERMHYPLKRRATITSSSKKLERIIEIGLRSAALCMHDNIMDCPWRERRQWIGDVQRINLISYYTFGEFDLPRAVLEQHVRLQDISGRMWVCQPVNEEFPSQSMEWLRAVLEYAEYSNDNTLLPKLVHHIELLHGWFMQCRNRDGLFFVGTTPVTNWMDNTYGSNISPDANSVRTHQFRTPFLALNLRYLLFLDDLAITLGRVGRERASAEARIERTRLASIIHEHFWEASRGLYRDSADPSIPITFSEMAHALIVLTDLPDVPSEETWDRFLTHAANHPIIPSSPFGKFHTFEALGKLNRPDQIVSEILQHWGPMIEQNSDTAWESFSGEESRCHGWAGTPAVALLRHVLKLDPRHPQEATGHNFAGVDWIRGQTHPCKPETLGPPSPLRPSASHLT